MFLLGASSLSPSLIKKKTVWLYCILYKSDLATIYLWNCPTSLLFRCSILGNVLCSIRESYNIKSNGNRSSIDGVQRLWVSVFAVFAVSNELAPSSQDSGPRAHHHFFHFFHFFSIFFSPLPRNHPESLNETQYSQFFLFWTDLKNMTHIIIMSHILTIVYRWSTWKIRVSFVVGIFDSLVGSMFYVECSILVISSNLHLKSLNYESHLAEWLKWAVISYLVNISQFQPHFCTRINQKGWKWQSNEKRKTETCLKSRTLVQL